MSQNKGIVVTDVKIEWNQQVIKEWPKRIKEGTFKMAWQIAGKARDRAPYVTGALRNSIHIDSNSEENAVMIIAGGDSYMSKPPRNARQIRRVVDYAAKREKGPNRNPTTEHYMENAAKDVMSGDWQQKYFGGLVK